MTREKPNGRSLTSRRSFLKAAGATGVAAGFGGLASAQPVETFEFDGGIGGWNALAPSSIEGEQNPTLELEAGKRYKVAWHNIDGFRHNFAIVNSDGDEVVRTPVISEQGVTQTVAFTATEDMAEYFCEIHPRTMRGDVSIAGREEQPEGRRRAVEQNGTVGVQRVADGLTAPLALEVGAEDRDRRYVVDQTGQIYVHGQDGLREEPFLDVSDRMVDIGIPELNGYDERGLLGLAFHPEFSDNRRFYVHYSAPVPEGYETTLGGETDDQATETASGDETTTAQGKSEPEPGLDHVSVIAEFQATEDFESADPDSERRLMEIPSPQDNHNGGAMAFGPDGYLYFGIGDGGAADDVGKGHVEDWYDVNEGGNGQDITSNLLGSVHRIDVDNQQGDKAYAIPEDNPLVGQEGLDEQYAWGFRNPWKLSFDDDGRLFVADAGQNLFEEVNVVEKGGNYGWNVKEADNCFSTDDPSNPDAITECPDESPRGEPLQDPEIQYRHRESTTAFIDGSVVVGGYVYNGDALADLQGDYVFGNWSGTGVVETDGEIFVASEPEGDDDEQWSVEELTISGTDDGKLGRYVMGFGEGQDGELYVLTSMQFKPAGDTGEVFKLVPEGEGDDVSVERQETTEQSGEEGTTEQSSDEGTTEQTDEGETTADGETAAEETTAAEGETGEGESTAEEETTTV